MHADGLIQETSEPIVENGAILEETRDAIVAFDYDDDQRGGFTEFDNDLDDQAGAFGGFDDDYDDDFSLKSNHRGTHICRKSLIDRTRYQA
jgi:hypothetical protein